MRVLVVGDLMLDEFVYGEVRRISPEAPTPVMVSRYTETMAGGAANVALGIAALECDVDLVGVVGRKSGAGSRLLECLGNRITPILTCDSNRETTHKIRFVSHEHSAHLLRLDHESAAPLDPAIEAQVASDAMAALEDADVLVISDYCKGVITKSTAFWLMAQARLNNKPVIVDSKRTELRCFTHGTVIKLNESEIEAFGKPEWLVEPDGLDFEYALITQGEKGMMLYQHGAEPVHIPGVATRVRDVSGAGDTVLAVLAACMCSGGSILDAVHRANQAAAVAVSKPGTAVVTLAELRHGTMIAPANDWSLMYQRCSEWRSQKVGVANGCFDVLHSGHLALLKEGKRHCDKLVVALNSDASVRRLKGEDRPVQSESTRADVLAALTDLVDLVVVFEADDPTTICEVIRPDVIFKGSEYRGKHVAGSEFAFHTHFVERVDSGPSTSQTVARMRDRFHNPSGGDRECECETVPHDTVERVRDSAWLTKPDWCHKCHGRGPCLHGSNK